MFIGKKNAEVDKFLKKCQNDMEKLERVLATALAEKDRNGIEITIYEYQFCSELYDMFSINRGGLGYFINLYKEEESPLLTIFEQYLEKCNTEPHLLTEHKILSFLDKVKEV